MADLCWLSSTENGAEKAAVGDGCPWPVTSEHHELNFTPALILINGGLLGVRLGEMNREMTTG